MTKSFTFDGLSPIGLPEFVDYISTEIDLSDWESICEASERFYKLSLDRSILDPFIMAPLKAAASLKPIQIQNHYTDSSFILTDETCEGFFIRANVWKVPREISGTSRFEEKLYLYAQPHDHDFDFLTVGYHGPGYRTTIYEYDPRSIIGYVGEPVDLAFVERTTLPKGKVMFYRKSIDVHDQAPPESLSISLNLMVEPVELVQQYSFDTVNGKIAGFDAGYFRAQMAAIDIAAEIGDETTADIMLDIARRNPSARVRAKAFGALRVMLPDRENEVSDILSRDSSEMVRLLVEQGVA